MGYTIDRSIEGASLDDIESRTRKALVDAGFDVLSEIDGKATMKKIDKDMPGYVILVPAIRTWSGRRLAWSRKWGRKWGRFAKYSGKWSKRSEPSAAPAIAVTIGKVV